jgi:hypothetical protein
MLVSPGAAARGDGASNTYYGGIVFAFNQTEFRVWAPSQWPGRPNTNGRLINIGNGWGKEKVGWCRL